MSNPTMGNLTTSNNATILLVDDMPILLEMLQEILAMHGYHALIAADGAEAYNILTQSDVQIDLVLTDMFMPPGISGVMLAQKIYDLNPAIPVILATGDDNFGDDPLPPNIKGTLTKPCQPKTVIERIKSILSS